MDSKPNHNHGEPVTLRRMLLRKIPNALGMIIGTICANLVLNTKTIMDTNPLKPAFDTLMQCTLWALAMLTIFLLLIVFLMTTISLLLATGIVPNKISESTLHTPRDNSTIHSSLSDCLFSVKIFSLLASASSTAAFGSAMLQVPRCAPKIGGAAKLLMEYMLGCLKALPGILLVILFVVAVKSYASNCRDSTFEVLADAESGQSKDSGIATGEEKVVAKKKRIGM